MLAVRLAFLRAMDATEADTFRAGVVQNFDRAAVEGGNDRAGEVSSCYPQCLLDSHGFKTFQKVGSPQTEMTA